MTQKATATKGRSGSSETAGGLEFPGTEAATGTQCSASPGPRIHPVDLSADEARDLAEMFRVLGDPSRVLILQALIAGDGLCVQELAERVGATQSAVSHQLRILRTSRLVTYERRGRKVFYTPDDEHVAALMSVCAEHVRHP